MTDNFLVREEQKLEVKFEAQLVLGEGKEGNNGIN